MYCKECGLEINDGSKFCQHCGSIQMEDENSASDENKGAEKKANSLIDNIKEPLTKIAVDTATNVALDSSRKLGEALEEKGEEWLHIFMKKTGLEKEKKSPIDKIKDIFPGKTNKNSKGNSKKKK